jgi:hypothetical protein
VRTAIAILLLSACGGATVVATNTERPPREQPPRLLNEEEAAQTHTQAMTVHVQAQELLDRCGEDEALCRQALSYFELAADTWGALIDGRPNDIEPEWWFMYAQALRQLDRWARAAEAAETYLSLGQTEWRGQAALLAAEAREHALGALREEPPEAEGGRVESIALDAPVHAYVEALLLSALVHDEIGDEERHARAARLRAGIVLYRYGQWERAIAILRPVFYENCTGEAAWEGAAEAWRTLHDIAVALEQQDVVRTLGEELATLSCDFAAGPPSCGQASEDPRCIARVDRVGWFLRGGTQWLERARQARAADRATFFSNAGDAYLGALDTGELDARGRLTALEAAGNAFREGGANDRAADVDEQILREVDPRRFDESDRPLATTSIATALTRQLAVAVQAQAHADIVAIARRLLEPALDLPELADERERARDVLPDALEATGRHTDASRAYLTRAAATQDPALRRTSMLRASQVLPCAQATRGLRSFVAEYRENADAADDVVHALWRIAECARRSTASLEELAAAGDARNLNTESASYAAEARFVLVDRDFTELTRFRIEVPGGTDVEDMVAALRAELEEPTEQVGELLDGYARVEQINSPRWSAAARYRSGMALEALDRAVLAARWELPSNVAEQRRILSPAGFETVRRNVELRAQEILRAQAEQIRCRAIANYQRAVQIAAASAVDAPEVNSARERLAAIQVPLRCPR